MTGAELQVVLVDDHLALRKGIELLLRGAGFRVTGSAETAIGAREMILARCPDAAIVDIALPDGSGIELARDVVASRPEIGVLLYTGGSVDQELLRQALASGARGVALKAGAPDELVAAIRTVAAGGDYVDPRVARLLDRREADLVHVLSPREREVLGLLAEGLTGEEIAQSLVLSPQTVQTHVRNLMRRLRARTRVHALAIAIRHGELEVPA